MKKRPFAVFGLFMLLFLVLFMNTDRRLAVFTIGVLVLFGAACVFIKKYSLAKLFTALTAVAAASAFILGANDITCLSGIKPLAGQSARISGTVIRQPNEKCCEVRVNTVNGAPFKLYCTVYFKEPLSCETDSLFQTQVRFYDFPEENSPFYFHTASKKTVLNSFAEGMVTVTKAQKHSPRYYINSFCAKTSQVLRENLSENGYMLANALLLGDTSGFTPAFSSQIRLSGISHLFAVSGMHLSLWCGGFFLLFRRYARIRWLTYPFLSVFILFYMAVTGFSPSVLRAGIMLLFAIWGEVFKHLADPLNSLGLSCVILLCVNPFLAANVSFLLSVAATASMFTVYPLVEQRITLTKRNRKLRKRGIKLLNSVLLSLGVLLFTLPFSAYFFGTVSLLSPVSSVICTLPAEGIMLASFLGTVFGGFSKISCAAFWLSDRLSDALLFLIENISKMDFGVIPVSFSFSVLWLLCLFSVFAVVYYCRKKNTKEATAAVLIALILSFAGFSVNSAVTADNTVLTAATANNATSFVITTRLGGSCAVIGTGTDEPYDSPLINCLQRNAVTELDYLLIPGNKETENRFTESVLTAFPVKNLLSGAELPNTLSDTTKGIKTNSYSVLLWNAVTYQNQSDDTRRVGILEINGVKTVFCFYPATDFGTLDSDFRSGDILFCRAALPKGVDLSRFTHIIVFSRKTGTELNLPAGAFSTADTGIPTVTVNKSGKYHLFFQPK